MMRTLLAVALCAITACSIGNLYVQYPSLLEIQDDIFRVRQSDHYTLSDILIDSFKCNIMTSSMATARSTCCITVARQILNLGVLSFTEKQVRELVINIPSAYYPTQYSEFMTILIPYIDKGKCSSWHELQRTFTTAVRIRLYNKVLAIHDACPSLVPNLDIVISDPDDDKQSISDFTEIISRMPKSDIELALQIPWTTTFMSEILANVLKEYHHVDSDAVDQLKSIRSRILANCIAVDDISVTDVDTFTKCTAKQEWLDSDVTHLIAALRGSDNAKNIVDLLVLNAITNDAMQLTKVLITTKCDVVCQIGIVARTLDWEKWEMTEMALNVIGNIFNQLKSNRDLKLKFYELENSIKEHIDIITGPTFKTMPNDWRVFVDIVADIKKFNTKHESRAISESFAIDLTIALSNTRATEHTVELGTALLLEQNQEYSPEYDLAQDIVLMFAKYNDRMVNLLDAILTYKLHMAAKLLTTTSSEEILSSFETNFPAEYAAVVKLAQEPVKAPPSESQSLKSHYPAKYAAVEKLAHEPVNAPPSESKGCGKDAAESMSDEDDADDPTSNGKNPFGKPRKNHKNKSHSRSMKKSTQTSGDTQSEEPQWYERPMILAIVASVAFVLVAAIALTVTIIVRRR